MKMTIEEDLCIGCGSCADIYPKVFKMVDGYAKVMLSPVPAEDQEAALDAERSCPVSAISHNDT